MEVDLALKAVQENPQDGAAHYSLARAFAAQQKWQKACKSYQAATELIPDHWEAYHHWGDALINLQNWEQAISVYRQALAINPQFDWSHHNLGVALLETGNPEEAIACYRQALAINQNNPATHYRLAQALARVGEWSEAAVAYEQAAIPEKENWKTYHEWGDALINLERWDEAVGVYQKASTLNPDFPWTYHNLGLSLLKLELYTEAITFFKRAIELNPDFATAHFNLGEAHSSQRQWNKAIAAYQKTVSLNASQPGVYRALANAQLRRANRDRLHALKNYQRALPYCLQQEQNAEVDGAKIYLGMAAILAQQEKLGEALFCCHRGLQLRSDNQQLQQLFEQLHDQYSKFYESPSELAIADYSYALWRKYNGWHDEDLRQMFVRLSGLEHQPVISLILAIENFYPSAFGETIASILSQVYPYWELCIVILDRTKKEQISAELAIADSRITIEWCSSEHNLAQSANIGLERVRGELVAALKPGVILTPQALAEVAIALNQNPATDIFYGDEDCLKQQKMLGAPWFKPDWCPDLLLCRNYFGSLVVCRRSLIDRAQGFCPGYGKAYDYELILRLTEISQNIAHIPRILCHRPAGIYSYNPEQSQKAIADALQRRGEPGKVTANLQYPGIHTIRYQIKKPALVSIIIPTRNQAQLLDDCLQSIFNLSTYPNYEILVIDNGSDRESALKTIAAWQERDPGRFRSLRLEEPFNYAHLNNVAAQECQGEYLLFLNDDTQIIVPDWIEGMVEQAQRPSIGAVGALLLYADDTVQHAGVILGVTGIAGHGHRHFPISDSGYNHLLHSTNNYSAVTAACLMCRRQVFEEVNGFDEQLAVAYNDVDLCLKFKEQGYHNIFLPHVILRHYESRSRSQDDSSQQQARILQEVDYMQQKWSKLIMRDPCYSINLTKETEDYSLDLRPQAEVVAVFLTEPETTQLLSYFIDEPKPGRLRGDTVEIMGWAIGKEQQATSIEVLCEGKIVAQAQVNILREDVARVYPHIELAKYSGFTLNLKLADLPHDAELNLQATLSDRTSVRLAKVLLRY